MTIIRNIATLNVRSVKSDDDKLLIKEDAIKYKIEIIILSDTHLGEERCIYQIQSEKYPY